MNPVTAIAPANIALIKYWGTRAPGRPIPANPSLSMTLRLCVSRCTVEEAPGREHEVFLRDRQGGVAAAPAAFAEGVVRHLERLLEVAGERVWLRVTTGNSFPTGAGLASSASGFAALALAVAGALERPTSVEELSILARLSGSGSAARSVLGGYVLWPGDVDDPESPAREIAPPGHWDVRDVIAVVDPSAKEIGSRTGHERAVTSPHYERRQELLPARLARVHDALLAKDFDELTAAVEEEAIELHLIAMSSQPPIFYWSPGTLEVLRAVRHLRRSGIRACFTIDAGPNVHVLCPAEDEAGVVAALEGLPAVRFLIRDGVGEGPVVQEGK